MSMFDAIKSLGNPMELLRKAREMQDKMKQIQDELAKKQVSADAGGGMVSAVVNGRMELVKVRIDKTKIDPNDTELLEDVITAAVAAAQAKAAALVQSEMQRMAADAGLPPGMLPGAGGAGA
jgi:DNA-binding YbaB/EbfC family protein